MSDRAMAEALTEARRMVSACLDIEDPSGLIDAILVLVRHDRDAHCRAIVEERGRATIASGRRLCEYEDCEAYADPGVTVCGRHAPYPPPSSTPSAEAGPVCCEIVVDAPCGRTATRYNAGSGVTFCDAHGGENPPISMGVAPHDATGHTGSCNRVTPMRLPAYFWHHDRSCVECGQELSWIAPPSADAGDSGAARAGEVEVKLRAALPEYLRGEEDLVFAVRVLADHYAGATRTATNNADALVDARAARASEKARGEAMRGALERYGEHDGDCAASVSGAAGDTVCTCGYDAACMPAAEQEARCGGTGRTSCMGDGGGCRHAEGCIGTVPCSGCADCTPRPPHPATPEQASRKEDDHG